MDTNTKHFYSIKNKDMKVVVREKKYIKHNVNYLIYSYDTNFVCYNDYNSKLFRSVIFSYPEDKIISFSLPKSLTYELFCNQYPLLNESIVINNYIDGIMFHLFYDKRIQSWELSYKRSISYNEYFRKKFINILSGGINNNLNDVTWSNDDFGAYTEHSSDGESLCNGDCSEIFGLLYNKYAVIV